ncbi:phospho-N-acetylmuramoyl-pentapeptide-transferase [Shouchella clausii]|jgi:phospho-N-acetylmuramoyl-pentapeptide-transferase|uniref:Phospho-N-acetylmuramoyl-pentapeptide-transferase n=1 Tax=Shouchella clausii TaxID=79880 RepID=A0A268S3H9_SHOCL|nr:phospho-N-acetylmuramoyl-pentapeptide-transferase [Shouchella clausii]PAD44767.1 phospho-N-acetylmuramoyl-pentapeptide-transferase [Bacillus sp. 7520-S]SPU22068.1 phospho-N-acetylmuramoyl-pentapeptide-transferase [Niallia circulans]MBU8596514.1 phospho-N-acetylmuramoyl-pentapeptide-transferase [Shouchella clausii]MCM3547130.1 phospho-N-acetylmuramoyl-pentapeptide-transferase [Shouchella clausii]MCY1103856.1 phospho-N-acetylmuramoyl-pentapeptide-transferase [Shouchella clausii]
MEEWTLLFVLILSFAAAVIMSPLFIPFLRKLKFGQSIREEGPKSHQKKSGTPTMGGIVIVLSIFISALAIGIAITGFTPELLLLMVVTLGYGIVGFVDDYLKVVRKHNLGLTSKQKLAGQLVIAAIFYIGLLAIGFDTFIAIPGTTFGFDLGWFYLILIVLMLLGASNAVNLTDGLDGLLAGTGSIAFGAFAILAWSGGFIDTALFSTAITGALLGFLVFNAHPAKVFMGDTGSLALGGAIAAIAILTKMELMLIIVGGVFVIETLSVIIQVASFKLTGKRVFRMSPLHHHYELVGWSEWRVVVTFWLVGMIFAIMGIYIGVWLT